MYPQHAKAYHEAFGWYHGSPPSADEARGYFTMKAVREPGRLALYAEALDIFLDTWWKIPTPA